MKAAEIRRRFLDYFQLRGHELLPSASLVPADDPTLLFTNAGMVQFKKVFLGEERVPYRTAVTAQKCVRAGGKHNDLEQVGLTARHHTFFEMLGNFSFGDYFKREAIHFAWEFVTGELGLDPDRILVTVHETDDEAHQLWRDVAGLPATRILRLGDRDNFWQMADTGPCGPCSEVHYDLRPGSDRRAPSASEFEALGERGEVLELWNLVFMQFDRDSEGNLAPLPAPAIDTGAGLERLAAVLQGVDSNYHTDLFLPLLDRVAEVVGRPYRATHEEGVSYRVMADHARAVAFLLADGVLPSNEGRGYVLRRILRRGVRHAWLLGLSRPALVEVVGEVVGTMQEAYPELGEGPSILETVRGEEERFLSTIEGGMTRFEELAPTSAVGGGEAGHRVISGEEAFKLYDTFGFPLDLTEVMARERGWEVDEEGFREALEEQRARSRADRAASEGSPMRVPASRSGPCSCPSPLRSGSDGRRARRIPPYGRSSARTDAPACCSPTTRSMRRRAARFRTPGSWRARDGGSMSPRSEGSRGARRSSGRSRGRSRPPRVARFAFAPACTRPFATIPSGITRRHTSCTRPCGASSAIMWRSAAPSSTPSACGSTSRTPNRCRETRWRRSSAR
jgi:alanyl-tRNA synthetase